jgi:hypothetical protein
VAYRPQKLLRAEEKPAVVNDGGLFLYDGVRIQFSNSEDGFATVIARSDSDEAIQLSVRQRQKNWIASAFALRATADASLRSQ